VLQVRLPTAGDPRSAYTASDVTVELPPSHLTIDPRSGEPPPLPPCQACCRRPHGAHAVGPGERDGRATSVGPTRPLCHWARLKAGIRATVRPSTVPSVFYFFSFLLIIPETWIKFKKHRKYNKTQKNMK
jgi:hypothetical protein